jgi:hypothetical protein
MDMRSANADAVPQTLLLIGFTMVCCIAGTPAFGADATVDTPTWFSLRQQTGDPVLDLSSTQSENQALLRQAPALTGRFQLQDRTYIPFIGAGFGGGYTSERDRALGSGGLFPSQSGGLGKNMMPNEFNVGLRIPF